MKSIYSLFFVTLLIACSGFNYGPVGQAAIEINQLSTSSGIVILEQYSGRVLVKGRIRGLKPFDQYTFNLHDESVCLNLKAKITGSNFDALTDLNSRDSDQKMSSIDPGKIINADKIGNAEINFEINLIDLGFKSKNIIGKSFVIYQIDNIKNSDLPIKLTGQSNCAIIQEKIIPIQIRADEQFAFTMNTSKVVYAN